MDFPDYVRHVSTSPVLVNAYDTYSLYGWQGDISAYSSIEVEFLLPNDSNQYQLSEFDAYIPAETQGATYTGPMVVMGGISLSRNPTNYSIIAIGYAEGPLRLQPTVLSSIALSYPSAYGMVIINFAGVPIHAYCMFNVYARPIYS